MLTALKNVLDMACDTFGCRDYLQGYICILFILIALFSVFQIISDCLNNKRIALKMLRYSDYDKYVLLKRRHRNFVVFAQKTVLFIFAWPIIFLWLFIRRLR